MKRSPRQIAGLVMMGSGLLLTTGALLALVMAPPTYKASAKIIIQQKTASNPVSPSDANASALDPYWISTESERMQAKVSLYPVITNLNLQTRWAKKKGATAILSIEETYRLLKERLEVEQVRGTSLFEISVFSEDPKEAAEVANAIAHSYRQRHAEHKDTGGLQFVELVQIVDSAEAPSRPARGKHAWGLLPVILFGVGFFDILFGYLLVRPTLVPVTSLRNENGVNTDK